MQSSDDGKNDDFCFGNFTILINALHGIHDDFFIPVRKFNFLFNVTGTPGGVGVGRTPPLWMRAGDTVEVDIDGIGTLMNPIHDADA